MTKIEFLKQLFRDNSIHSTDCGQRYEGMAGTIWVDTIARGRISIKVKPILNRAQAQRYAEWLKQNLLDMTASVVDAATKADTYEAECRGYKCGWSARLRCDKHW